jgi:hypothetical protein
MKTRRRWSELNRRSRAGVVGVGVVQVALLGATLADLRRREQDELTAPRWVWCTVAFINVIGPLAYFVFGRRRPADREQA